MATMTPARAPIHLWIVGILSLVWSCFGAYDYTKTRLHDAAYISATMPGVDPNVALAWVAAMPLYAQVGWGFGVWLALAGSILLLVRSRWAVWAYGISFVGAVLSLGYQLALAPPLPGADATIYRVMPLVIIAIALALYLYARRMEKRGLLR
ncbi:MAG: hypothetical protein ABIW33_08895 [Sphingomicrobium sp.]